MKRREFITTSALGTIGLGVSNLTAACSDAEEAPDNVRKILIYGGGSDRTIIEYLARLTKKEKPRICYLPTAAADNPAVVLWWYRRCAGLNLIPLDQNMFVSSYTQKESFEEVLLSMDAIVVGGGNTLNMIAIWKAQGVDKVLRKAWDKGIILSGGSAGSLCWFEEGTTDSRPKEITKIECLGFLKGSHSPHYDAEEERRPVYQKLIRNGELKPGIAVDNNCAIYFENDEVKRIVATDNRSNAYYVSLVNGNITEKVLKPDEIL